jgi:hypothetical protein
MYVGPSSGKSYTTMKYSPEFQDSPDIMKSYTVMKSELFYNQPVIKLNAALYPLK